MSTATASTPPPIEGATPLFGVAALAAADRQSATRHRIPSIVLMERAGWEAARCILTTFPQERAALVLCGGGNNGGDGYVVARHLLDAGWDVEIAVPRGLSPRTPDAMTVATVARTLGLRGRAFTPAMLDGRPRLVVDALLGIGGRGAPRGQVAAAIDAVNAASLPVVALDTPSGVDADTGHVEGTAIRADLTLTFHGDKTGLHVAPGRAHAGRVEVVDIGIPAAVRSAPRGWLLGADAGPMPAADPSADKYGRGAVLVVAGSPGLTGAGVLTARAALRAGAGLVVAAVPATVQPIYAGLVAEVMAAPIADVDGHFSAASVDAVVAQAARVRAIALGPGLGRDPRTTAFVGALLREVDLPAVVDADGLWHLDRRPVWLRDRRAGTVLTPHTGEAARLLGRERLAVDRERLASAAALADLTGAVTVLKGPGTLVVAPDGVTLVDGADTPALATAGSGDVLTGIVAAALAGGAAPLAAAACAVAAHSRAGVAAGRGAGTIAGDLVEALPGVIAG